MAPGITVLRLCIVLLCVSTIALLLIETNSSLLSRTIFQQMGRNACACGLCLSENDTWFMARLNQSVEPFLSKRGYVSEDAFNWWKTLQEEKRNFTTFKEIVDTLFQIFPPNPYAIGPSPHECRTCAVVGNSGNLKGSGYGRLIDDHDVIMRINYGKTKGYEADVGNRTTHRIMYPESSVELDNVTHLVLFPFKIKDIEWLLRVFTTRFPGTKYKLVKTNMTGNMDLVRVLNPAFMKYVYEAWLDKMGQYPSTGFMSLILALHLCGEVDAFGFGADRNGSWSHYFEELQDRSFKTGVHPGPYEYKMIRELDSKQRIKFYSGS